MTEKKEYIYVQPHALYSEEHGHGMAYSSDLERFPSVSEALHNGYEVVGSDDFLIATLEGNKLVDVQFGTDTDRERDEEEWNGIAEEFGFDL